MKSCWLRRIDEKEPYIILNKTMYQVKCLRAHVTSVNLAWMMLQCRSSILVYILAQKSDIWYVMNFGIY